MATAKTNRSSFFVSSRGKIRATIPDHRAKARVSTPGLGTNDRIRQTNITVGLLTAAEENPVSSQTKENNINRYG
jgi:hypothetical protein